MDAEVYCANLTGGGACVGAASLVSWLPDMLISGELSWAKRWRVLVSPTVAKNIVNADELARAGISLRVREDRPRVGAAFQERRVTTDARLCYRVPEYSRDQGTCNVAGFADPTILARTPSGVRLGLPEAALHVARRAVKRRILTGYNAFVVQTASMARELGDLVPGRTIDVVLNSPSEVLADRRKWRHREIPEKRDGEFRLFYPSRGYPHKNHRVIPEVARLFAMESGLRLTVVTTLRESELAHLPTAALPHIFNVGELSVSELGSVYEATDGVFLPTLNEVSSATPLEGMLLRRPVFASDREFVRESALDVPFYFDPMQPASIADSIIQAIRNPETVDQRLDRGTALVESLPSARDRACAYVQALSTAAGIP